MGTHHRVATAVLVNSNRVLLCHRHPNRRWYPNVWDIPGGHIEDDETPAEAVVRELREELDVTIRLNSTTPFRIYDPAPDLTLHAWVITEWSGDITNLAPDEHDEIRWFDHDELVGIELADDALSGLLGEALTYNQ
ncbi:MAG: mutator protein MutT [Ilumatobacter sp.]|jgi:mutator protein MutT